MNEEETAPDETVERPQQQQQSWASDENITELASMLGKQMDLMMEQKVAQAEQAAQIRRLIGSIDQKLNEISTRQDRLEIKQEALEAEVARVNNGLGRNTSSIDVECFESRLSDVENRVQELGEWLERIQKEMVPALKESILEELLDEIKIKEAKSEITNVEPVKKWSPEKRAPAPVNTWSTPNFPSTERRRVLPKTPTFQQPEHAGQLSSTNMGNSGKLLQKPISFDGSGLWESYYAQFEIVATLNNWNDHQKAAYLATSLKGPALAVLGNLAPEDRQNLDVLVVALKNRFGTSHQTELSRMKFKNRVKQRDESLPELAEDIERLSRLSYPDAPPTLRDVLARDQFVDALPEEDTRLRIKQERPQTLRRALESALELESFNIAARQRQRVSREAELTVHPSSLTYDSRQQSHLTTVNQLDEGNIQVSQIVERLERSMKQCLDGVLEALKQRKQSWRGPGCWNCGELDHIRRNCPKMDLSGKQNKGQNSQTKKGNEK